MVGVLVILILWSHRGVCCGEGFSGSCDDCSCGGFYNCHDSRLCWDSKEVVGTAIVVGSVDVMIVVMSGFYRGVDCCCL